jgi:hypothetical protein
MGRDLMCLRSAGPDRSISAYVYHKSLLSGGLGGWQNSLLADP